MKLPFGEDERGVQLFLCEKERAVFMHRYGFFLSAKRVSTVYERVAASLLRGHLFSTDLEVTQPLVYQYFTMMNSSSISCNWSL